jgi:hypothetical protein
MAASMWQSNRPNEVQGRWVMEDEVDKGEQLE